MRYHATFRYASRSTANVEAVKAYVGQEPGFPRLRVAYVPIPNGSGKPEIVIRKGQVTVTSDKGKPGEVQRVGYLFERFGDVVTDTPGVVAAILKKDGGDSTGYKMMCGANESVATFSAKKIVEKVQFYLNEYDNHDEWFHGVIGYRFDGQTSFNSYLKKRKERIRRTKGKP